MYTYIYVYTYATRASSLVGHATHGVIKHPRARVALHKRIKRRCAKFRASDVEGCGKNRALHRINDSALSRLHARTRARCVCMRERREQWEVHAREKENVEGARAGKIII